MATPEPCHLAVRATGVCQAGKDEMRFVLAALLHFTSGVGLRSGRG